MTVLGLALLILSPPRGGVDTQQDTNCRLRIRRKYGKNPFGGTHSGRSSRAEQRIVTPQVWVQVPSLTPKISQNPGMPMS